MALARTSIESEPGSSGLNNRCDGVVRSPVPPCRTRCSKYRPQLMQKHSGASANTHRKPVPATKASASFNCDRNPGEIGAKLSRIKDRLRDLGTDNTLSVKEREPHRVLYEHERDKLQSQLNLLANEKQ